MQVRVRFAPSPTGNVHIGNIRVAIFNWLYARSQGGVFLLRVEDTDRERSTPEAIQTLHDAMAWLGLEADEEPCYQSKSLDQHMSTVETLISQGHASCAGDGQPTMLHLHEALFDSSFVTAPRDEAEVDVSKGELFATPRCLLNKVTSSKGDVFITPINWDALTDLKVELENKTVVPGEILLKQVQEACADKAEVLVSELTEHGPVKLRFKRRYVFFEDQVMGLLEKPLDSMRDLVIVRSDGSPVFHLANVVDDVAMGITHILRGNDHVENTYRHLFLFKAIGAEPPQYAHFPMIVNAKGKPYSKRDGDAYVGDFRSKGYLPECLFNFLALCGWSPGDDREILSRDEMVQSFGLDRVIKSAAQFNTEKLEWMNGQYLSNKPVVEMIPLVREELAAAGIEAGEIDADWLAELIELEKERLHSVKEFVENTHFFWVDTVELQPKPVKKNLLKKDGAGLKALEEMKPVLAGIEPWTFESLEATMEAYRTEKEVGMGMIAQPIRTAITGTGVSRGIWETLVLLGKEKTLARIERCLAAVTLPSA